MAAVAFTLLGPLASAAQYSPAFLWSTKASATAAPGLEHLGAVSGRDVEHMSSLLGGESTELQLVFLAEGLTTEAVKEHGSRLPTLNRLLQTSGSSLTMPFTTAHDSSLFARATHVPAADAEDYFKTHASTLFTNGVPDTVLVDLPTAGAGLEAQLEAHDAAIARLTRTVHAGTKGNYAALLTASRGGMARTERRRLASGPKLAYLHTTPTLLTAQLVMLILMIIFLSGFCCLFSLQVRPRTPVAHATSQIPPPSAPMSALDAVLRAMLAAPPSADCCPLLCLLPRRRRSASTRSRRRLLTEREAGLAVRTCTPTRHAASLAGRRRAPRRRAEVRTGGRAGGRGCSEQGWHDPWRG